MKPLQPLLSRFLFLFSIVHFLLLHHFHFLSLDCAFLFLHLLLPFIFPILYICSLAFFLLFSHHCFRIFLYHIFCFLFLLPFLLSSSSFCFISFGSLHFCSRFSLYVLSQSNSFLIICLFFIALISYWPIVVSCGQLIASSCQSIRYRKSLLLCITFVFITIINNKVICLLKMSW